MSFFGLGDELLWWCPTLDNSGANTTTLNDLSGNGRNGTLVNMVTSGAGNDWVADTTSGGVRALDFDGNNDFVISATNALPAQTSLTASAWVNTSTLTRSGVLTIGSVGSAISYIDLLSSGVVRSAIENLPSGGVDRFIFRDSSVAVVSQGWRHVLVTVTTSALNVFVSGVNRTTGGGTSGSLSVMPSGVVSIGRGFLSPYGGYLPGRLDDVRLFGRVLSQAEINKLASRRGYQEAGPIGIFAAAHNAVRGAL